MTRKNNIIAAISILIIFALCIAYFIISIAFSMKSERMNAYASFDTLVEQISSIFNNNDKTQITAAIDVAVSETPQISSLKIYNSDNIYYSFPNGYNNNAKNANIAVQVFSRSIPFFNDKSVTITASIVVLQPHVVFNTAKKVFIIILLCTIVVIILLINSKPNVEEKENIFDEPLDDVSNEQKIESIKIDEPLSLKTNPFDLKNSTENLTPKVDDTPKENITPEQKTPTPTPTLSDESVEQKTVSATTEEIATTKEEPDAKIDFSKNDASMKDKNEIFSEITGYSKQSLLETRLDQELQRTSAFDQDLSLVLIKFEELTRSSAVMKKLIPIILKYFETTDMFFEYDANGFAGILPNSSIDDSMHLAHNIFLDITKIFEVENINNKFAIGISSKSIRIIPATRIILEAEQALKAAFEEEEVPIVAFRVNTEKYKQFLDSKA